MGIAPEQFGRGSAGDFLVRRPLCNTRGIEHALFLILPPAISQASANRDQRNRPQNDIFDFRHFPLPKRKIAPEYAMRQGVRGRCRVTLRQW